MIMSNENMSSNLKIKTLNTISENKLKVSKTNDMLCYNFFNVSCEELAKALLGKVLVRRLECGTILRGNIVETECYLGGEDKASHSYNGRQTPANQPMYMPPGTAYVYMTYGMYYCFNISSAGDGAAVLLRAVDPTENLEYMHQFRSKKKKDLKIHQLCNGPSKLCMSFNIKKDICNKLDLCNNEMLWIENDENVDDSQIVTSSRIGINSAGEEWAKKPLRFYILGNKSVSKRDKVAEEIILSRVVDK